MSSQRLVCTERNAPKLHKELADHGRAFIVHYQRVTWIVLGSNSDQDVPANLDELFGKPVNSVELELFVLCLIHFGCYSLAYEYFDKLDLERLTGYHQKLNGFQEFDVADKVVYKEMSTIVQMEFNPNPTTFRQNQHLLLCKLDVEPLLDYLENNELIEVKDALKLRSSTSRNECIQNLINLIETQHPRLTSHTHHALLQSGQFGLFDFLVNEKTDWMELDLLGKQHRCNFLEQWNHECENVRPESENYIRSLFANYVEPNSTSCSQSNLPTFIQSSPTNSIVPTRNDEVKPFEFSVDMPDTTSANDLNYYVADKANIYKNFSVPKGLVLLINNENFDCDLNTRHGTARDEENLRKLFTELGYTVLDTCKDLTALEMLCAARSFVKMPEHRLADSCVVIVLTHGEKDALIGVKGNAIHTEDFIECFNSRNAPLLAGKPKLFIIQACRGSNYDNGVHVPVDVDQIDAKTSTDHSGLINYFRSMMRTSPKKQNPSRKTSNQSLPIGLPVEFTTRRSISLSSQHHYEDLDPNRYRLVKQPTEADIVIAYATVPKYVSWRNSVRGSWFVQSICEIFGKYAAHEDVLPMLTRVHQRVARLYESTDDTRSKQIPETSSRLQRKMYFFPGIRSED